MTMFAGVGQVEPFRTRALPSGVQAPRLPVRASFGSHRDRRGEIVYDPPYFPYYYWRWKEHGDLGARDIFYSTLEQKRKAGVGHVVTTVPDAGVYREYWLNDEFPGAANPDWRMGTGKFQFFLDMLILMVDLGHVPIDYAFGGGQKDAPAIYDGRLDAHCRALKEAGLTSKTIGLWAWESYGLRAECTAKQNSDAWEVMWAAHGGTADAMIAGHIGPHYPSRATWGSNPPEPDDPTGGQEGAAWYIAGGRRVKIHFAQLPPADRGAALDGWQDRRIDALDRFLPTGTALPGVGTEFLRGFELDENRNPTDRRDNRPFAVGPYWFGAPREVGPVVFCDQEPGIPYNYIRERCTDQEVQDWNDTMDRLGGIDSRGCLPVPA